MRPRGLAQPTYSHQGNESYLGFANYALLMGQWPRIEPSAAMPQCCYSKLTPATHALHDKDVEVAAAVQARQSQPS